jgi:hypothetical protein
MFFERDRVGLSIDRHIGLELMGLGNFVDRLEEAAPIGESKYLPCIVRSHCLNRRSGYQKRRRGLRA